MTICFSEDRTFDLDRNYCCDSSNYQQIN